jgi:hypothetical protein
MIKINTIVGPFIREKISCCLNKSNLVPRACDPREGTRGSEIIRFREESDWPLKWNAQLSLSQDSWLPATDYPRASRSFPRIAGSGNEIEISHERFIITNSQFAISRAA